MNDWIGVHGSPEVGGGRPATWTWGALLFAAVALGGVGIPSSTVSTVLISVIAMGGAWVLGRTVGDRRVQAARAVRESARRAAAEERLHLARELHDVPRGGRCWFPAIS